VSREEIDELLRYDPLSVAQKVTGESYKDDEGTMALGFGLAQMHSQSKRAALQSAGDTYYGMPFVEMVSLLLAQGFEQIHARPVRESDVATVWWHPKGLLLEVDSFTWSDIPDAPTVNGGKVYYNVLIDLIDDAKRAEIWRYTSSGGTNQTAPDRWVWAGDHDIREGLLHAIEGLSLMGEVLPVWEHRPFLGLLTSKEYRSAYPHKIRADRIAAFPQHVQDAIRGQA
jgi:hypothetical protein